MLRIAPRILVALLCGGVLAGCATTSATVAKLTGGDTAAGHAKKEVQETEKSDPTDLDGSLRQAQLLRSTGHYDEAIHILSQIMLVASDDPRVVAEYGKTLTEKGRAQDAVEFLNRAIELSSNDWTLYSALGVSYDQLGDQTKARTAYDHALALRPEEPSVLNNYALSRMLAGDTDGARQLIARAQSAGGASDSKIAANIAMLNKIAPAAPQNTAVAKAAAPVAAPVMAQAAPPQRQPVAQNMPRPIIPSQPQVAQQPPRVIIPSQPQIVPPRQVAMAPSNGVVMQPVPFDPYAGPVGAAPIKLHPPAAAKAAVTPKATSPAKVVVGSAKPAAAPKAAAPAPAPAKAAEAKPAAAATKTADAKPAAKAVAVKASSKDQIPALRMSANAY